MSNATFVWVCIAIAGCATGGGSNDGKDVDAAVTQHRDAANVTTVDAPVTHADAGQDAQVSQLPDAGSGSGGLFCQTNSQCTVSGECCVTLGGPNGFCAPGDIVLGQCVPQ